MAEQYLPIMLVVTVAVLFAAVFIGLSYWLGPSRPSALKASSYECGIPPRGSIQIRFFRAQHLETSSSPGGPKITRRVRKDLLREEWIW